MRHWASTLDHGHTSGGRFSPTYMSYVAMKQRCLNPNSAKYLTYGGRGITIADEWVKDFKAFLRDMGERPKGKTLDRINTDGNYCRDNCRWATAKEQAANRRPFADRNSLKSHCPAGHEYGGSNLRLTAQNGRKCKTCERNRATATRLARRLSAPPKTVKPKATHCRNGHKYTEANTKTRGNLRVCRACQRDVATKQRPKRSNDQPYSITVPQA